MQTKTMRVFPKIKGVPLKSVHERCVGCNKMTGFEGFVGKFCTVYPNPAVFWRRGGCPIHPRIAVAGDTNGLNKMRVGQQKQKKKTRKK